nr:hypothetical protein [Planotetraspora kaengkrachanensis]
MTQPPDHDHGGQRDEGEEQQAEVHVVGVREGDDQQRNRIVDDEDGHQEDAEAVRVGRRRPG